MTRQLRTTTRRAIKVILLVSLLAFAALSLVLPGPLPVHWNASGHPSGITAPSWVIGVCVLGVMGTTFWVFRGSETGACFLAAEATAGMFFLVFIGLIPNPSIFVLLIPALAGVASYFLLPKMLDDELSSSEGSA